MNIGFVDIPEDCLELALVRAQSFHKEFPDRVGRGASCVYRAAPDDAMCVYRSTGGRIIVRMNVK